MPFLATAAKPLIEIRRCTVAELDAAPNLEWLMAEYADESSLEEIGKPEPQRAVYYALEKAGILFAIGAFDGAELVGFILPIVAAPPHYGVLVATIESFFVAKMHRTRGVGPDGARSVGTGLRDAAADLGRELGAKALLTVAPAGGVLSRVLAADKRCRLSNEVYIEALS